MTGFLILLCLLGNTAARNIRDASEVSLDFDGAPRTRCPATAHQGNQPADRVDTKTKLRLLRTEMVRVTNVHGPPLDGYIVTSDDAHQSETVAPHDARREYMTGFLGSSGEALITADKAVFWTDGRYHIQADQQLDCNWTLMKLGNDDIPTLPEWLMHEFRSAIKEVRIGADPTLIPADTWENWQEDLSNSSVRLVPILNNLVDTIWKVDHPAQNLNPAFILEDKYTGRPWQEKVREVRMEMELAGADALVLTALDEIAWLFNIRAYDIPYTPVLRSYAVVTHGSIYLYVPRPERKLSRSVNAHLKTDDCAHADCVKIRNYTSISYDLRTWAQVWTTVWLPAPCGYARGVSQEISSCIPLPRRLIRASPIIAMRSVKNPVEIRGMEAAHIRDAIAMCEILADAENQIMLNTEGWDELQVSRVVKKYRYEQDNNMGISFATIAAYGPHAALPHYEPVDTTNIAVGKTSTLVIDSGGQYKDGTTDVTRTLHYGEPTPEQKEAYTRVLIGSIQLASLVFPSDLRTNQLDILAREPLWSVGLDYLHGTGHGIGHFLSVHESPISVSYYRAATLDAECSDVSLKPGSFLSNEPGYYKEGDFGVRLENILEVIEANMTHYSGEKFLKFKDITLVPYEPKLIDIGLLAPSHRRWLNDYNERIRREVGPELKQRNLLRAHSWMMNKTEPIPEDDSESSSPALSHCFFLIALSVSRVFFDRITDW